MTSKDAKLPTTEVVVFFLGGASEQHPKRCRTERFVPQMLVLAHLFSMDEGQTKEKYHF